MIARFDVFRHPCGLLHTEVQGELMRDHALLHSMFYDEAIAVLNGAAAKDAAPMRRQVLMSKQSCASGCVKS